MLHGSGALTDYLKITDPTEQIVANAILEQAEEIAAERRKRDLDNLSVVIHNAIVGAFK